EPQPRGRAPGRAGEPSQTETRRSSRRIRCLRSGSPGSSGRCTSARVRRRRRGSEARSPRVHRRPRLRATRAKGDVESWLPRRAVDGHCTFAVSDALALSVKLQVFVLAPPLLQTPDQMASRSFETLSVTRVPAAKLAEPVLPTSTLSPAGLEETVSPERPVAVRVS